MHDMHDMHDINHMHHMHDTHDMHHVFRIGLVCWPGLNAQIAFGHVCCIATKNRLVSLNSLDRLGQFGQIGQAHIALAKCFKKNHLSLKTSQIQPNQFNTLN